jgi:hypothetical protein
MDKWRKVGRIIYASYPFVLAGMLIILSAHLIVLTTENTGSPSWGEEVITIPPSQTYGYNVTISYIKFPPNQGPSILRENGSIIVEEYPIKDTVTSWTRIWLPITIKLNETPVATANLNSSLVGPEGVIEDWQSFGIATGGSVGIVDPEVTQGGTYRLLLQNIGSHDVHLDVSWNTDFHVYDKPHFYYGVLGLVIALFYPSMFLFKRSRAAR